MSRSPQKQERWSGFGYFKSFAQRQGKPHDAMAWIDLSSDEKRIYEAFSELERQTETIGKERLVGVMEGIDAAIAKLEKKARKIQAKIQEMQQWRVTLSEEMEKARRQAEVAERDAPPPPPPPAPTPCESPVRPASSALREGAVANESMAVELKQPEKQEEDDNGVVAMEVDVEEPVQERDREHGWRNEHAVAAVAAVAESFASSQEQAGASGGGSGKRPRRCALCHADGHNSRSCPVAQQPAVEVPEDAVAALEHATQPQEEEGGEDNVEEAIIESPEDALENEPEEERAEAEKPQPVEAEQNAAPMEIGATDMAEKMEQIAEAFEQPDDMYKARDVFGNAESGQSLSREPLQMQEVLDYWQPAAEPEENGNAGADAVQHARQADEHGVVDYWHEGQEVDNEAAPKEKEEKEQKKEDEVAAGAAAELGAADGVAEEADSQGEATADSAREEVVIVSVASPPMPAPAVTEPATKKRRGRPPKSKTPLTAPAQMEAVATTTEAAVGVTPLGKAKSKRGRPKKAANGETPNTNLQPPPPLVAGVSVGAVAEVKTRGSGKKSKVEEPKIVSLEDEDKPKLEPESELSFKKQANRATPKKKAAAVAKKSGREEEEAMDSAGGLQTVPNVTSSKRRKKAAGYREACEVCGRHGLTTSEKLQTHLKTHIEDGARACPIPTCKQVMKNTLGLSKHLLVGHHRVERTEGELVPAAMSPDVNFVIPKGVMLECFECEERFKEANDLDIHIRKHMTKKYPRDCNLVIGPESRSCNFKASTQDDMARHIILAHYELQAECSACGVREEDHECTIRPQDIEGKRVSVRWLRENDIAWYEGTVKRYVPATDTFEIFYDDGTQVTESLSMRYWRPLEPVIE